MPDTDTTPLLFTDVETSGLEERTDYLLEVGLAVVTADLTEVIARKSWVCPWPPTQLAKARARAHPDVQAMHDQTGLWEECRATHTTAGLPAASITAWVAEHTTPAMPLAGSSVHFDARWLALWAPAVVGDRTYRMVDVSGLREFLTRYPTGAAAVASRPVPVKAHRVDPDIDDSLAELRHYRDALGLLPAPPVEVPVMPGQTSLDDHLPTAESAR
jgi:oligoribonuclease